VNARTGQLGLTIASSNGEAARARPLALRWSSETEPGDFGWRAPTRLVALVSRHSRPRARLAQSRKAVSRAIQRAWLEPGRPRKTRRPVNGSAGRWDDRGPDRPNPEDDRKVVIWRPGTS
jgi:hypothetical protein